MLTSFRIVASISGDEMGFERDRVIGLILLIGFNDEFVPLNKIPAIVVVIRYG